MTERFQTGMGGDAVASGRANRVGNGRFFGAVRQEREATTTASGGAGVRLTVVPGHAPGYTAMPTTSELINIYAILLSLRFLLMR